jgi:hypothetical protein
MPAVTRVRLGRAFAVLAVIAGVLAMHGLASDHHGAAASPVLSAVLSADVDAAHTPGHAHAGADARQVAADGHQCDLLCQSGEHGLAMLCVAVLLAVAAAVLVLRQRTGGVLRTTGPPSPSSPRTLAPPRSFDLVAELCVSRT